MSVKIRLSRHGKKGKPFYHIVIADSRSPRDGRFIERIGSYNPITAPASIELDFDRALLWMQRGAQPTDTVRAIMSYKGVLYKNHLLKGVKKNALTMEQVEVKFAEWLKEKQVKISETSAKYTEKRTNERRARLSAEVKVRDNRANAIAKKRAPQAEAQVETEVNGNVEE